jgi:hypothetical protein
MKKISINDVDPGTFDTEIHADRRSLSEPLNTSDVAITYYVLESGERFSGSVHTHMDQEEVFFVIRGTATFEMRAPRSGADGRTGSNEGRKRPSDRASRPRSGLRADEATRETKDGEITVGKNEAIRFAPGEFQSGRNDTNSEVVAFALGAPRDSEYVRISRIPVLDDKDISCPNCDRDSIRLWPRAISCVRTVVRHWT